MGSPQREKGLKRSRGAPELKSSKIWPEKGGLEGGTSLYHLPMCFQCECLVSFMVVVVVVVFVVVVAVLLFSNRPIYIGLLSHLLRPIKLRKMGDGG